ncbi:uncharacterized protein BKA78DRAFT_312085 [Phyllosticta capitalensis]|uniref:uncharacterized protein n=1 Tax=Phyllosticta capitalensis TaxID=121624 RepID=UPI00312E8960
MQHGLCALLLVLLFHRWNSLHLVSGFVAPADPYLSSCHAVVPVLPSLRGKGDVHHYPLTLGAFTPCQCS